MITQLGKDIFNAQYRILDHRVFVNGEVESFVNNFETQRDDSEVTSLFKVTETIGAIKYELSDRFVKVGSTNLEELSTELKSLSENVQGVIGELQKEKSESDELKELRLHRAQRKEEFERNLKHNYQRLDHSFATKEEEISELYSDLQLKLNIPSTK